MSLDPSRSIYSFGSPCSGQYGQLVLCSDGSVYGYSHPNERAWSLDGDELRFHSEGGGITSRYSRCGQEGAWIGRVEGRRWPLYLIPALTLEDWGECADRTPLPPVFVNSIPKSGTYYHEAAFAELGYRSQRLHLIGHDIVDDYRGLNDREIHVDPARQRLSIPLHFIGAILRANELIVGHVEVMSVIDAMRQHGVLVISAVRNLRDVLVSLYRFKLAKVLPQTPEDMAWREVPEEGRFLAFLNYYEDKDVAHIRSVCELFIADSKGVYLRYEDVCQGVISSDASDLINAVVPGMSKSLGEAFEGQYGHDNPTFSNKNSRWRDFWSDEVESLFISTALLVLNRQLGYE